VPRHPFLHAWWLQTINYVRRARTLEAGAWIWPAAAGAGVLGLGSFVLFAQSGARWILMLAEEHFFTLGVLLALQSSALTHLGRGRWSRNYYESWLSTTPVSRGSMTRMIAWRSSLPSMLILAAICLCSEAVAHVTPGPVGNLSAVLLASLAGTWLGALVGWWLPQREVVALTPNWARGSRSARTANTLCGLSHWPLMQTRAWLQPRALARLMILALGLPLGMPANVAVAILWLLIVGTYVVSLLAATVRVAKEGTELLRPTPLSFRRFAWAVLRYSILKQLQWTLMAAAVVGTLSHEPQVAFRIVELWLAVVSVVSSIGLTCAFHSRPMGLRLLVSAAALSLLEGIKQHTALPCALLFSGWQLRQGARS
jgi:hypothetical protein